MTGPYNGAGHQGNSKKGKRWFEQRMGCTGAPSGAHVNLYRGLAGADVLDGGMGDDNLNGGTGNWR